MSIFNFFNNKNNDAQAASMIAPVIGTPELPVEATSNLQQETPATVGKPLTVSYATGWPIDLIYGYMHKNYEEKGYNDAMVNSDLKFKDLNRNIIRNKILMVFREINLKYDMMKQGMETQIETCNAAGLLTTVAELEKNLSIIKTHKVELERLEGDFRNNANEASVALQSYESGFLRGVSTIVMAMPNRGVVEEQEGAFPVIGQRVTA